MIMNDKLKKLEELMKTDKIFAEKAAALQTLDMETAKKELIALAAEQGIEITLEELEVGRELSDEEAELIAGGGLHDDEGYLKTTIGYCCSNYKLKADDTIFPTTRSCLWCKHWRGSEVAVGLLMIGVPARCEHPANRTKV